jgi:hypothetical protein
MVFSGLVIPKVIVDISKSELKSNTSCLPNGLLVEENQKKKCSYFHQKYFLMIVKVINHNRGFNYPLNVIQLSNNEGFVTCMKFIKR